jgi:hypothetical protein
VAALIRVREEDLEDFILATAPEFIEGRRQADEELARGNTRPLSTFLEDLQVEQAAP